MIGLGVVPPLMLAMTITDEPVSDLGHASQMTTDTVIGYRPTNQVAKCCGLESQDSFISGSSLWVFQASTFGMWTQTILSMDRQSLGWVIASSGHRNFGIWIQSLEAWRMSRRIISYWPASYQKKESFFVHKTFWYYPSFYTSRNTVIVIPTIVRVLLLLVIE